MAGEGDELEEDLGKIESATFFPSSVGIYSRRKEAFIASLKLLLVLPAYNLGAKIFEVEPSEDSGEREQGPTLLKVVGFIIEHGRNIPSEWYKAQRYQGRFDWFK